MENKGLDLIEKLPLVQIRGPDAISQNWDFYEHPRFFGAYVLMNGFGRNYLFSSCPSENSSDLSLHFLNSAKALGISEPRKLFTLQDTGTMTISNQENSLRSKNSLFAQNSERIARGLLKDYFLKNYGGIRNFT
jgi:hypothetical protein